MLDTLESDNPEAVLTKMLQSYYEEYALMRFAIKSGMDSGEI